MEVKKDISPKDKAIEILREFHYRICIDLFYVRKCAEILINEMKQNTSDNQYWSEVENYINSTSDKTLLKEIKTN